MKARTVPTTMSSVLRISFAVDVAMSLPYTLSEMVPIIFNAMVEISRPMKA